MGIRLGCCVVLMGLLISPAMADIAVTLEQGPGVTGLVYADIPLDDAIVGFGFDVIIADPDHLTFTGFTTGPLFSPVASTPDGDGIAGLVAPADVVYGPHVLIGTLSFAGTGSWIDLDYTPTDLTEGFALPAVGEFAVVTFTGAPEPAALMLLALGALLMHRR